MSQLAASKHASKKARQQEKRRLAEDNKEKLQRQRFEELEREFPIEPEIRLNNNGPDDTDLINAVNSGSVIALEKVLKERDGYSQEALNKSLMIAASNGHKLILILILKYGADTNWTDENCNTPLMVCAEKGFLDMAKILISNKANSQKINTSGNTALILSVMVSGAADMARLLVSSSKVNVKNNEGQTALSKAVGSGDLDTIHILISNGANLNDVINGETIQELAAKKGILQYIHVFTDCKSSKDPPLIAALKYKDISLLENILTYEPNSINQRTSKGCSILEAFFDLILKEKKDFTSVDKSIVKLLITRDVHIYINKKESKRSSVKKVQNEDFSILVKAVQMGDLDIVKWLYVKRPQVNESVGYNQLTPLMMASKCGFIEIIQFLLSKGADIDIKIKEGTSLDLAIKHGNLNCAKILLEEKAKKGLIDAYKIAIECKQLSLLEHLIEKFPLDTKETRLMEWAIQSGSVEILQHFINNGMDVNASFTQNHYYSSRFAQVTCPLHFAAMLEKPDLIKILLQSKADIDKKDANGNTALFYASMTKGSKSLRLLLNSSSDVNITNNMGKTPLFVAIESFDKRNVTLLLKSGASVNIRDTTGETPMFKAIQFHSLEIVSLLIDWKADTNAIAKNGGTYIIDVVRSFYNTYSVEKMIQMLQLLLKESNNINKKDDNGDTALIIACKQGYSSPEAVEILLKYSADVNLFNNKNETALSLSLTVRSSEFRITKMLLQKKATFYKLSICQQAVHLFVSENELELIRLALGNGVFPFVVKSRYSGEYIFYRKYNYDSDLSPLSLALLEKRFNIAKYLIQVRFLTKYDVSDLLEKDIFQKTNLSTEQGSIFKNLLSLYTLSFVQISEMLGATLNREEKVNQLPLPQKIKQQLLFQI